VVSKFDWKHELLKALDSGNIILQNRIIKKAEDIGVRREEIAHFLYEFGIKVGNSGDDFTALKIFGLVLSLARSSELKLRAKKNLSIVHNNYALILKKKGKIDKFEEHILKALELDPENFWACNNYANFLFLNKLYARSEEYYKQAIAISPSFLKAKLNYVLLLYEEKRYDEAFKILEDAHNSAPDKGEVYYLYGNILFELGKYKEAALKFKAGLETVMQLMKVKDERGAVKSSPE